MLKLCKLALVTGGENNFHVELDDRKVAIKCAIAPLLNGESEVPVTGYSST